MRIEQGVCDAQVVSTRLQKPSNHWRLLCLFLSRAVSRLGPNRRRTGTRVDPLLSWTARLVDLGAADGYHSAWRRTTRYNRLPGRSFLCRDLAAIEWEWAENAGQERWRIAADVGTPIDHMLEIFCAVDHGAYEVSTTASEERFKSRHRLLDICSSFKDSVTRRIAGRRTNTGLNKLQEAQQGIDHGDGAWLW